MTTFQLSNQFASKAIIHPEYEPEASEFESPHGTYFESPHGTYIDYLNDPELGFMNPLDQMGFTNPSNDVVTNDLQTSWQGSVDKMPWDLFRPAEGNAKETGELLGHPVITDASGAFVSTSQETLVTSWRGSWDKFSIKPSNDEFDGVSDQVAQLKTGIQTGDGFDTVPYELQAGMGISANARGKTTGTIAALQIEPAAGDDLIPDEPPGVDIFTTGAGGDSFNCDDILLGHGAVHPDMPMDTHPNDILLGFPGSGAEELTNYRPEVFSEVEIHFVQSVDNDHDPAAQLRSDNRFAEVPVELFQGLDAGGMNYAEAVGLDSSTVDVVNKLISSLQPANEFI